MEVKNKPAASVRDYWRSYRRMYVRLVIISQLLIAVAIYCIAVLSGIIDGTKWEYMLVIAGIFALGVGVTFATMSLLIDPMMSILRAMMYRRDEHTTTTPPNPNAKHYRENGFRTVLQTIYGDDDEAGAEKDSAKKDASSRVKKALDAINTGLVLLDDKGTIIEANKAAPVVYNSDREARLALDFLNQQTLEDWVSECGEKVIRAEKIWRRIPVEMGYSQERRVYGSV